MILNYQAHKCSPEGICFTLIEYIPLIKVWTCGPVLWSVGWGVSRRCCRSCLFFSELTTSLISLFITGLSRISTYFLRPVALSILFWKEMSIFLFSFYLCNYLKWLSNTFASIDSLLWFLHISFTSFQNVLGSLDSDSWIVFNIELCCFIFYFFFRLDLIEF